MAKGSVPAALKAHQFKAGSAKASAMGTKGGKKSPSPAKSTAKKSGK